MWTHHQLSGVIDQDGLIYGVGHSGAPPLGRNNPSMQAVREIGPIPQGLYEICDPLDCADHGEYSLPLRPNIANEMFGRSRFCICGDTAPSRGSIIMERSVRERIVESGDTLLMVVA